MVNLINGDCLDKLRELDDNSVDSVVTDPPYGFSFMGKSWDYDVPSKEIWMECMRVLKPGGYLLSFSGARTYHRMAVEVEDAGFEIRDQIMWVYGSGFPKSHNVGKAVDKLQGNEREVVGKGQHSNIHSFTNSDNYTGTDFKPDITVGQSEWEGWGTALKPAHEPIVMARKPFKGTVANNVMTYGTGAINIDGCRVSYENDADDPASNPLFRYQNDYKQVTDNGQKEGVNVKFTNSLNPPNEQGRFPANFIHDGSDEVKDLTGSAARYFKCASDTPVVADDEEISTHSKKCDSDIYGDYGTLDTHQTEGQKLGRFPANFIHDGSDEVVELFPDSNGSGGSTPNVKVTGYGDGIGNGETQYFGGERTKHNSGKGSAARFFYCAKASKKDRNAGCEHLPEKSKVFNGQSSEPSKDMKGVESKFTTQPSSNNHPTVKPNALMRYLCRLVTRPGGVVLDPFMGSGSTGRAALEEGFSFIGIEREPEYFAIAEARCGRS